MTQIRRKIWFFIVGICIGVLPRVACSVAAVDRWNQIPSYELIRPSNDRPNPHNPFWITTQQLGFVVGQEIKGEMEGGLYTFDFQTKEVKKLLGRYVFDAAFLPELNRLSFVAVGKPQQGITLFTKSVDKEDLREYNILPFSPSWSPDKKKVAFANLSYDADLFIADVETGKLEALGDLGRGKETNGTEAPDWSPTGREIVYVGWDKTSRTKEDSYVPKISRIYRFDVGSHNYRRLTSGSFQDREPAYSPDGKYIAFMSNRSQNFELWLMNRDGTNLRRLTDMGKQGHQVALGKPAWSPDQKRIAFSVTPSTKKPYMGGFPFEGAAVWVLELKK